MADLFLIQSDDPEAVRHAVSEARRRLLELGPEYVIDQLDGSNWSLVTGRNPFVPYAASADVQGAAVVLGSTFDPGGPKLSDLLSPSPADRDRAIRNYCRGLNYGMALSIRNGEVLVAPDWLGLYPVYYHEEGSTFMVSSVPGLFTCHDRFRSILDIQGLVGILLLAHSSLGLTMFQGVTRLASGHFLKHPASGRAAEEAVARAPRGAAPKTMDEAVETFDAALAALIGEASRETAHSVLLSGGLDSRIAAGYLYKLSKAGMAAVTLGNRNDTDMRAAVRVASLLGARHETIPVDDGDYPVFAGRSLNEDAMSGGLFALSLGPLAEAPRPPMLTGLLGDSLPGADYLAWGREAAGEMYTFHALFRSVNEWGLSPGVIHELVRARDVDDIIIDTWRRLRNEYDSYPGEPWRKTWWFLLFHHERFLMGRVPKVMALRSWPVIPFACTDVLDLAASTPVSILADRRLEIALILRKFPELARLPFAGVIERIGYRLEPEHVSPWTRGVHRVMDSVAWHAHKIFDTGERRWWMRSYDINGTGWKILRDQARLRARAAGEWLDESVVLDLIPPSSAELPIKLRISAPTGRRTLIGAVLCCSQYFAGSPPIL